MICNYFIASFLSTLCSIPTFELCLWWHATYILGALAQHRIYTIDTIWSYILYSNINMLLDTNKKTTNFEVSSKQYTFIDFQTTVKELHSFLFSYNDIAIFSLCLISKDSQNASIEENMGLGVELLQHIGCHGNS